jgi:hypothetical protein
VRNEKHSTHYNWQDRRRSEGGCTDCRKNKAKEGRTRCEDCLSKRNSAEKRKRQNPAYREKVAETKKKHKNNLKRKVIELLGGKCACCSESIYEFLTLDHIVGDGAQHRRELKHFAFGTGLYSRLLKDLELLKRFQILCWNCNCSIGIHGFCPHKGSL